MDILTILSLVIRDQAERVSQSRWHAKANLPREEKELNTRTLV